MKKLFDRSCFLLLSSFVLDKDKNYFFYVLLPVLLLPVSTKMSAKSHKVSKTSTLTQKDFFCHVARINPTYISKLFLGSTFIRGVCDMTS